MNDQNSGPFGRWSLIPGEETFQSRVSLFVFNIPGLYFPEADRRNKIENADKEHHLFHSNLLSN